MTEVVGFLNTNPLVALFLLIGFGILIGRIEFRDISLGTSGVLFVAILFGHFGVRLPGVITQVGVALFVYAIGLQAGPKFFKTFRSRGIRFAALAIATLLAGLGATFLVESIWGFGAGLSTGLYTGAMTSTPGLAAAMEAVPAEPGWASAVSVGYGVSYPFGVIGVVLFVQVLPRLMRLNLGQIAKEERTHAVATKPQGAWVELRNLQLEGISIGEFLTQHLADIAITRIEREDGQTIIARTDIVLQKGDKLRIVYNPHEEKKIQTILGPFIQGKAEPEAKKGDIVARDYFVTEDTLAGRTLEELNVRELYGIIIARLWREEIEFVPQGDTRLEIGDLIRVVGTPADCDRFQLLVGHSEKRLRETNFLPLCFGLALGAFLGLQPLTIPGTSFTVKLGLAGGPLFVALIAGHFGRIGRMSIRMPVATKIFIRELGLVFFLAGAGISAGAEFWDVIRERGVSLLLAGAIVTTVPMAVAWFLARFWLKLDVLSTLGAICGGMTSTPGLGAVSAASDSESPAIAYATIYPVALIFVTVFAQILGRVLFNL